MYNRLTRPAIVISIFSGLLGCASPSEAPGPEDFYQLVKERDYSSALEAFAAIPSSRLTSVDYFEAALVAQILCDSRAGDYFSQASTGLGEDFTFRFEHARYVCAKNDDADCAQRADMALALTSPRQGRTAHESPVSSYTPESGGRHPALQLALAAHCATGDQEEIGGLQGMISREFPEESIDCSTALLEYVGRSCTRGAE